MTFGSVKPHPEWRLLKAAIEPLLETKKEYSYEDLKALGVDVQSERGRQQFYKFRKFALREWNVWFENTSRFGYVLIPAGEHPKSSVKRVRSAKRRIKLAAEINAHVKTEQLTSDQLLTQAQMGALLDDLSRAFNRTSRQLSTVAAKYKLTEADVKQIAAPKRERKQIEPPPDESMDLDAIMRRKK